jgi:thioredoxin 1
MEDNYELWLHLPLFNLCKDVMIFDIGVYFMQEVMKEAFHEEVIQSDRPVVVDFYGAQCNSCLALMPKVEALAGRYRDRVKIVKVEAHKNYCRCLDLKVLFLLRFSSYNRDSLITFLNRIFFLPLLGATRLFSQNKLLYLTKVIFW